MIALPAKRQTKRKTKAIEPQLTILSLGGGQDSTYLFYRLIYDKRFRKKYAPGDLLVIMSDTGDEHLETYIHVRHLQKLAEKHMVDFVFLTNDMGYHSESWATLTTQYEKNKTCGMNAGQKTCTVNLKINPIYRFVSDWVGEKYLVPQDCAADCYRDDFKANDGKLGKYGWYTNLVAYAGLYQKVRVIIGIAAGEEERVEKAKNAKVGKWMTLSVDRCYPLIDIGYDRAKCQKGIRKFGHKVPLPSNCRRCPFISPIELLWQSRFDREAFDEWVVFERNKLWYDVNGRKRSPKNQAKIDRGETIKSLGVFGTKTLEEKLADAEKKYGHMSDAELHEYKMSHGHCVSTSW